MSSKSPHPVRQAQGRLVGAHRSGDPERIRAAQLDCATERIAFFVAQVMEKTPPLTAEQRERISDLLRKRGV